MKNYPIRLEYKNPDIIQFSPDDAVWCVFWKDGMVTVTRGGLIKTILFTIREMKEVYNNER